MPTATCVADAYARAVPPDSQFPDCVDLLLTSIEQGDLIDPGEKGHETKDAPSTNRFPRPIHRIASERPLRAWFM